MLPNVMVARYCAVSATLQLRLNMLSSVDDPTCEHIAKVRMFLPPQKKWKGSPK